VLLRTSHVRQGSRSIRPPLHLLDGLDDRHRARVGVLCAPLLVPARGILVAATLLLAPRLPRSILSAAPPLLFLISVVTPSQMELMRALPQGIPRQCEGGVEGRTGRRCASTQAQRTPRRAPVHTQRLRASNGEDGGKQRSCHHRGRACAPSAMPRASATHAEKAGAHRAVTDVTESRQKTAQRRARQKAACAIDRQRSAEAHEETMNP
jgi:hypothetical protein